MLNSQIFQMSIKQFKLFCYTFMLSTIYIIQHAPIQKLFPEGGGVVRSRDNIICQSQGGERGPRPLFRLFLLGELKRFRGGGATPNLIAQFKYDSLPTSSALYQRRQISFDLPLLKKKAEELSFITIFYKKEQRKITC